MAGITITQTRIQDGVWHGLVASQAQPQLAVTHLEAPLEGVTLTPEGHRMWLLRVPIPVEALSDGVQTFLVQEAERGETVARFSIAAGAALSEDLRAEVDLLRAELDMLKRAFRRHCVETGA